MTAKLKAQSRTHVGSRHARRIREDGRIPATIQGGGVDRSDISILAEEFLGARRGHQHVFEIDVAGVNETALIRDMQWDAFGDAILHVEFRRVNLAEKTEAEVELDFIGHPKAGQLNHLVTHITIRAVPTKIPDSISVRVEGLDVGAQVRARDLEMPEGVELAIPAETPIAVISAIRVEVPAAPAAEAAAVAPVEGEGDAAPTA